MCASLYGLKQSPRQWYKRFDSFILSLKYRRSNHDSCVYFKKLDSNDYIYLLLYVDDMLIASKNRADIEELKYKLKSKFDMKDLGPARRILGMEITRNQDTGTMAITQESYIKRILHKFSMTEAKAVNIPIASHFKLSSGDSPTTAQE